MAHAIQQLRLSGPDKAATSQSRLMGRTPPNQRFQPTAFGADMRGAFCLYSVLVNVASLVRVGGG
jgi:hypothetical protein